MTYHNSEVFVTDQEGRAVPADISVDEQDRMSVQVTNAESNHGTMNVNITYTREMEGNGDQWIWSEHDQVAHRVRGPYHPSPLEAWAS